MILEDMYKEEQLVNIEKNIDTKVKKELENMTGMTVTTVNVHIQGINYETKKDEVSKVD